MAVIKAGLTSAKRRKMYHYRWTRRCCEESCLSRRTITTSTPAVSRRWTKSETCSVIWHVELLLVIQPQCRRAHFHPHTVRIFVPNLASCSILHMSLVLRHDSSYKAYRISIWRWSNLFSADKVLRRTFFMIAHILQWTLSRHSGATSHTWFWT